MASPSVASIQKSFKYDVFLSFRGEDTRKNFVDHLHQALKQKSINAYKDDENIKKGERITDELIRSIEDSKFYIIVFSKNYASSSWCLDELVKIMDCQKTNEHTAYPVFYDVEPTEVRKQSGAVEKAFEKHKEDESAEKWKKALREAADLAGWELKNTFDGHEAKLIQKIVEEISLERRSINPSVDEKLVGMETRVEDVVSSLEIDIEDVRMIGIWGMGGAGKTTLAGAVFDQISFRFDGLSFVENVREFSKGSLCGLRSLQKQVLSDVTKDTKITVNSVHEGKNMMKQRMCDKKVLLVLDDVDHVYQLQALAGELDWFKPGSRVIITTRDKQVLKAHRVNLILGVNLLLHNEAIRLFSRYAFGTEIPIQGYEELSERVVCYANGLPLSIKVLGSFLCGKAELEWADALERLKTIPMKETQDILELSYQSLDHDYKEIFLDVACILKGREKEEAIRALESCGFHARIGLRVLEQKSLITFKSKPLGLDMYGEFLSMHDHIEEMGKNIVRRLHPNEPHRHSRLWIKEEIEDILVNNKGTKAIKCIKLLSFNLSGAKKGFQKMRGLRFLEMKHQCDFGCDCKDIGEDSICLLPNGLRYLSLCNCRFNCFPKNFQPNNLVGLKLKSTGFGQRWKAGEKVLKNLRFIDIRNCRLESLNVGLNTNLERLNLKGCWNLVELHMPVESLKLKSLYLNCEKLKTLNLEGAQNLEKLELKYCKDLVELHMPTECLKLKCFYLNCSKLKKLNLPRTFNLQTLHLDQCEELSELYVPVEFMLESLHLEDHNMRTLYLKRAQNLDKLKVDVCEDLVDLQLPFEGLKFKSLHLFYVELETLDLTQALNLEKLVIKGCNNLVELHMPNEKFKLKSLSVDKSTLQTLDISWAQNLDTLSVNLCKDLVELNMPVESLELNDISLRYTKLKKLNLKGCRNLERLDLENCEDLVELNVPVESLELNDISLRYTKLKKLNLKGCRNLERLDLENCEDLVELNVPVESLELNDISLRYTKLKKLNLKGCRNLERLDLEKCEDLVELHLPLEGLKLRSLYLNSVKLKTLDLTQNLNLEKLDLLCCEDLVELQLPLKGLKFKSLLIFWSKMKTLDLTQTLNLETLCLEKCEDLVELHMPVESLMLKNLRLDTTKLKTLNLKGARNLEKLFVQRCEELVELHMPVESLMLKSVHVSTPNLNRHVGT
ncbi:TMV resistance protein N [Helianthus annuus]|nr:TMV resistance protein N [Helianthus annuus]XP_022028609.2 TMV resistance protein N [Helianthus annuus]